MNIEMIGKLNNRFQIQSSLGQITRTKEDFEILQENLLLEPSSLLVPQLINNDYLTWFALIFMYNAGPENNEIIRNFLTNESYYLTRKKGNLMSNVYSYLEKIDDIWTQNSNYHK